MHICVGKLTIIGLDNGLLPNQCHAIIWTNAGLLLFQPWPTNFREIWIEIPTFSLKKMHLKVSSAKWRRFCLGLNELRCLPKMQVVSRWGVPVEFWWVSDAGRVDFRISTIMPLFYRISLEKVGTKKAQTSPLPWHPNPGTRCCDLEGSAQDCGNSSASAMEFPQSCAKPTICCHGNLPSMPHCNRQLEGKTGDTSYCEGSGQKVGGTL